MFHCVVFCNFKMCLEECLGLSMVLRESFEDVLNNYSGYIFFIGVLAEVFGMVSQIIRFQYGIDNWSPECSKMGKDVSTRFEIKNIVANILF